MNDEAYMHEINRLEGERDYHKQRVKELEAIVAKLPHTKDKAVGYFTHYFRTAFKGVGLSWTRDNEVEMERLVDALLGSVADEPVAESEVKP